MTSLAVAVGDFEVEQIDSHPTPTINIKRNESIALILTPDEARDLWVAYNRFREMYETRNMTIRKE